jgi:O-antigen biosynthesis protein WbqP
MRRQAPGLTRWAQFNGRDELPIPQKVALDIEYMHRQPPVFDINIIILTAWKVLARDNVIH